MGPRVRGDDGGRVCVRPQLVVPPPFVIPAKAGIQYAGKPESEAIGRGVLGRPVKPGDDSGVCGVRLQPTPSSLRTQGPIRRVVSLKRNGRDLSSSRTPVVMGPRVRGDDGGRVCVRPQLVVPPPLVIPAKAGIRERGRPQLVVPPPFVIPAKAGIQYAGKPESEA